MKRILLVDDSPTVRAMVQMLLRGRPCVVRTAADGAQGLACATEECPDLILLDVMMPVMNGLEACQRLRAQPSTARVPILMMSSRGEPESIEAGYRSGCNDYLSKPFDAAALLAKVDHYLAA